MEICLFGSCYVGFTHEYIINGANTTCQEEVPTKVFQVN